MGQDYRAVEQFDSPSQIEPLSNMQFAAASAYDSTAPRVQRPHSAVPQTGQLVLESAYESDASNENNARYANSSIEIVPLQNPKEKNHGAGNSNHTNTEEYNSIDWEVKEAKKQGRKYQESYEDGNRVFETTYKDGTNLKVTEYFDGTTVRTSTQKDGSRTTSTNHPDGSSREETIDAAGRRTCVTRLVTPLGICTITENPDGSTDVVDAQGGHHRSQPGGAIFLI